MQRPPDKRIALETSQGGSDSGSAELASKQKSDSETASTTKAIIDATERAEDLVALWREHRKLSHHVRLARIRFELIGLDPDQQNAIADEVAQWGLLVEAFARAGVHVTEDNYEGRAAA
jgi:hypothetical protein